MVPNPKPIQPGRLRMAFSLIELIVVLSILAVLVAITLSAVQRTRASAARLDCQNKLKQIALAGQQYHNSHASFPPGCRTVKDPQLFMTWLVRILPYLEQQSIYDRSLAEFRRQPSFWLPLDGHSLIATPRSEFNCPLANRSVGRVSHQYLREEPYLFGLTWYQGVSGRNSVDRDGVLFADGVVRLGEITDGASNTLFVGERPPASDDFFGWWYAGTGQNRDGSLDSFLGVAEYNNTHRLPMCGHGPHRYRSGQVDDLCDVLHFWSLHSGGSNFAFADGSVRFLAYPAESVLPALSTRAGGETAKWE